MSSAFCFAPQRSAVRTEKYTVCGAWVAIAGFRPLPATPVHLNKRNLLAFAPYGPN